MRITFLRHGRSRADDENVIEGRYDSPLTEVGLEQARRLAAYWAANPPGFDRVEASTLVRASKTAEIVCGPMGLTPIPTPNWMELDNTPIAGLTREEAHAKYPMPAFRHRFENRTVDGGESKEAAKRRASLALENLFQSGAENALVVSHGGILNAALQVLMGCTAECVFPFGDTGFATIDLPRDRASVIVLGLRQQPHLLDR